MSVRTAARYRIREEDVQFMVQEVTRWRREVERFTPARLEEFEAGIRHALEHPAPLQRPEGQ